MIQMMQRNYKSNYKGYIIDIADKNKSTTYSNL